MNEKTDDDSEPYRTHERTEYETIQVLPSVGEWKCVYFLGDRGDGPMTVMVQQPEFLAIVKATTRYYKWATAQSEREEDGDPHVEERLCGMHAGRMFVDIPYLRFVPCETSANYIGMITNEKPWELALCVLGREKFAQINWSEFPGFDQEVFESDIQSLEEELGEML